MPRPLYRMRVYPPDALSTQRTAVLPREAYLEDRRGGALNTMKRTITIATLCIVLLATAGTTAVTAAPAQKEQSSIYSFTIAAAGSHGSGTLVIDLASRTVAFAGKGFTPGQRYWLLYDDHMLGSMVANKAGDVLFLGTWPMSLSTSTPPSASGFVLSSSDLNPLTASFTARFDHYYQGAATWAIDASSSTGPIYQYWLSCTYIDASGHKVTQTDGAGGPDFAIQLHNINPNTPVKATLTVTGTGGHTATSNPQQLPWS